MSNHVRRKRVSDQRWAMISALPLGSTLYAKAGSGLEHRHLVLTVVNHGTRTQRFVVLSDGRHLYRRTPNALVAQGIQPTPHAGVITKLLEASL